MGPQARRWRQADSARSILVGALLCLALICGSHAQAQSSAKKYPIDISRQGLTSALHQLWMQTGGLYGYSPGSAAEEAQLVGPVKGEFTIDEALTLLLRGTGLTFSRVDARYVVIVRAPPEPKAAPPKPPRAARRARVQPAAREEPAADAVIEEVVTWGAKYLVGSALSPPVLVIDTETIEHSGASNVMQLLHILPQQPFLRPDGFRSNGAQYAELRGLDPDMSLVLINGRRAFASAASFSVNAFDLNQIPLSAVKRVEVVLDSISVRHGADAIGGIINIVLRDDVAEPSVEAHYGTAAGGGEQVQGTISAGAFGDNGRATVILDYVDGQPLFGAERDLWNNQDYRRFGSIDQRSTFSSPGNVFPAMPGTLLPGGAPFAAISEDPNRTTTLLGGLRPFELNRESLLRYFPIVAQDRRASAVATAQADLTPDLIAAMDLMVVDRRVGYATAPPVVAAVVPATNPYNFVGQPVMVTGLLEGEDSTQASLDSLLIRGAASLQGKLEKWHWDLSVLRSEEDARQRIDNVVDPTKLALVLATPERTLNLLAAGPAGSPEVLASVLAPPQIDNWATDGTQLTGSLGGNLLGMPAGAVSGLFGAEWRKEAVEFDSLLGSFDREVAAGFAEVHVPLLSERMQLPAMRELTMTAAGRFDRYTDFGDIFSPQLGLVWKPLRDIGIRGTYGRSFRAPSMWQLYLPRMPTRQALSDSRRNGEAYLADQLVGGNPDLEPTRGKSFTAGIAFTPAALEPLAVSATYWHVELDSRVTALTPAFVLLHESDVPGRVRRAAPTAADLAAGLPGRVLQVDTTFMNFGSLETSGVDAGATYSFDSAAGHFETDVKATWIDAYETRDLPATRATDRVSLANAFGTIAKWRAIASVDWQRGALGATTYLRFIPSYNDTLGGVRNGRTIPSQTFLDLQLSLDLGQLIDDSALLRGLKFTAGAINAFNQEPHFAEVGAVQGYDTSQGDLKGRFWYLRLGKTF